MNNQEKARSIIERTVLGKQTTATSTALAITQALADAGLLMPELPEPGRAWADDDAPWLWKVAEMQNSLAVTLDTRYRQPVIGIEDFNQEFKRLIPAQARDLAHSLLAAAQWAEGDTND
ncbi:hypothetical protein [Corynebacterium liangguodongii]|uniref:Uncharacterized protein n=1 Tax=Corynebacterium liangguodongii TaxID=2079535 RepID=A0A2S0WGA7_9CORY|nr:hypothetical protein [Corynebacterium liangguodongii]AWB84803.1 hypothetical protein C3E79_10225 [Corynebacterium liangguodongii]PWB99160.1 hypothetical protein DF219_07840 [Corynebacterium liangguodongii]